MVKYPMDPESGPCLDSARLRQLRQLRGLTAREVAAAAGVSQRHLWRLEAGQRPYVAAVTLARVAAVLGTTMEYLLGMTPDLAPLPELREASGAPKLC